MLEKKSTKDLQEREELKERLIRLEETNRQLDTNVKEKEKSTVEATQESEYLKRQLRSVKRVSVLFRLGIYFLFF